MIQEAYCSYEVSKLLKEKGFSWECRTCYEHGELKTEVCRQYTDWNSRHEVWELMSAPTHQMACAWLREKGIYMSTDIVISSRGNAYFNINTYSKDSGWHHPADFYDSYEGAVEAALKYYLEKIWTTNENIQKLQKQRNPYMVLLIMHYLKPFSRT